jgi:hypothetical protein
MFAYRVLPRSNAILVVRAVLNSNLVPVRYP